MITRLWLLRKRSVILNTSEWWATPLPCRPIIIMAEHKVPQDVEAEDKLLGPFSFRQFVYLMIAVASGALMFFLGRVNLLLALVPSPVFFVFLILALPLRKDQPMETYVAALVHFYFQPAKRTWSPDGQSLLVEITNPPIDNVSQTKDFSGAEAAQRLSFLAEVADTRGWSTRGIGLPVNTTVLSDDFASDAINAEDIMDSSNQVGQIFDSKLYQAEQKRRDEAMAVINAQTSQYSQSAAEIDPAEESAIADALRVSSQSNAPTFQQTVIQPLQTFTKEPPLLSSQAPERVAGSPLMTAAPRPITPAPVEITEPQSLPIDSNPTITMIPDDTEPAKPTISEPAKPVTSEPANPVIAEEEEKEKEEQPPNPPEAITAHPAPTHDTIIDISDYDNIAPTDDNINDSKVDVIDDGESEISLH